MGECNVNYRYFRKMLRWMLSDFSWSLRQPYGSDGKSGRTWRCIFSIHCIWWHEYIIWITHNHVIVHRYLSRSLIRANKILPNRCYSNKYPEFIYNAMHLYHWVAVTSYACACWYNIPGTHGLGHVFLNKVTGNGISSGSELYKWRLAHYCRHVKLIYGSEICQPT